MTKRSYARSLVTIDLVIFYIADKIENRLQEKIFRGIMFLKITEPNTPLNDADHVGSFNL